MANFGNEQREEGKGKTETGTVQKDKAAVFFTLDSLTAAFDETEKSECELPRQGRRCHGTKSFST